MSKATYKALTQGSHFTRNTSEYAKWREIYSVCDLIAAYHDVPKIFLNLDAEAVTDAHKAHFLAYEDVRKAQFKERYYYSFSG